MAWEHKLAKELKRRDNPFFQPYLTGKVISPTKTVINVGGEQMVTYSGPLIVTIYDGQVRLNEEQLLVLEHCGMLYKGQTVALLGDQKYIVLGVV
jgi:hypothetical protein